LISIRNSNKERLLFKALACVGFPAIIVLSLMPNGDKTALHTKGRFHSLGHFLIFGFVAYVAGRTTRSVWTRIFLFIAAGLFGFGVELAEHLLYKTALEWKDVLVDFAGAFVGTLIAFVSASTED
jgi:VanZ family protein